MCVYVCVILDRKATHFFFALILPLSAREIENGWRGREWGSEGGGSLFLTTPNYMYMIMAYHQLAYSIKFCFFLTG